MPVIREWEGIHSELLDDMGDHYVIKRQRFLTDTDRGDLNFLPGWKRAEAYWSGFCYLKAWLFPPCSRDMPQGLLR